MNIELLNNRWLSLQGNHSVIVFYGKGNKYSSFSNFARHKPFVFKIPCGLFKDQIVNISFAEKAIMLCKASLMDDTKTFNSIMCSNNAGECKRLGRMVSPWNQTLWDINVCSIAKYIIFNKFAQIDYLKKLLSETGDKLIAEASPRDTIWGIGLSSDNNNINYPNLWKGSNILGWALMEVRDELRDANLEMRT